MQAIHRWGRYAPALSLALLGVAVQAQDQRRPDFTTRVDLVTTDVIVRDYNGQFIADLKKEDFQVFEDGVEQEVISFSLTHGGRSYNIAAPPPRARRRRASSCRRRVRRPTRRAASS